MSSGERTTTFRGGDVDALLRSYLIFVRDMRGQRRQPSIELRADDVGVLATHLGVSEETVLVGLFDLMGATRAQRSAMLAMLAAGALTVVLSGAVVSGLSDDGVSVEFGRLADAVHAAVSSPQRSTSHDAPGSEAAPVDDTPSTAPVGSPPASPATGAVARTSAAPGPAVPATASVSDAPTGDPLPMTPDPDVLRSVASAGHAGSSSGGSSDAPGDSAAAEPVSTGVAPDGSVVASVAPPVPTPAAEEPVATGRLPDGTTVGVAAPPVPPAVDESVATGQLPDGTIVGVAAPPVPPDPAD